MVFHVERIHPIIKGSYFLPHSMTHYLVYGAYYISNILSVNTSLTSIMILSETLLVVLMVFMISQLLVQKFKHLYSRRTLLLISLSLIIVSSIHLPLVSRYFYLGNWSPNTWHNPTTFLIKPIAFLCILGIYYFIKQQNHANKGVYVISLSTLFTLSVWAKPSFAITFYPALFIFTFIYYTRDFKLYIKIFLILLPSLVLLFFQYYKTYHTKINDTFDLKDNIVFTNFGIIKLYTNNILLSLISAIAFPISILIIDFKSVKNNQLLILSWFTLIISYLQLSFFA